LGSQQFLLNKLKIPLSRVDEDAQLNKNSPAQLCSTQLKSTQHGSGMLRKLLSLVEHGPISQKFSEIFCQPETSWPKIPVPNFVSKHIFPVQFQRIKISQKSQECRVRGI
jgi:hypothetical protein